jgi:lipoprotein-anchoring transpeptidase ErfK/SrfK
MSSRFLLLLASSTAFIAIVSLIHFPTSLKNTNNTGELAYAIANNDLSGEVEMDETEGFIDGEEVTVPPMLPYDEPKTVLGINNESKWIEVDLSEQKLRAWEGNSLYMESLTSTGLPYFPTPKGEFRIWYKTRATRMKGGEGKYAYNLPNVPHTMFFEGPGVPSYKGYGIHGAYWHNDFGKVHSHGCVNLPLDKAAQLYEWASPDMQGKSALRASADNLGTRVVIHE